jgi:hypothetical protein
MDRVEQWLRQVQATARRPVAERVAELMESVRRGSQRYEGETWDQASERHAEEFISSLRERFPGRVFEVSRPPADEQQEKNLWRFLGAPKASGQSSPESGRTGPELQQPVVVIERQKLKPLARRTTTYNYVFTLPGQQPQRLILVAHYDTWRGPGADDNTTGEEITKQYLLADLLGAERPLLTHTYLLAGSEECGLIGFTSQVLLAVAIGLANMALTKGIYAITALGIAFVPLAKFRFGVSGSREYVQSLSAEEVGLVKSVISVDSVGEGRMYIPETSLGADFVRAFIPFEGYDALDDVLEEAAHLNGIKYNTFIAGGTTDHVSFLEVNSTLLDHLGHWLGCPRLLGCHRRGAPKIPAAALVALSPGKASPLVFGGKIHTPADTPDRVYPQPIGEALRILDYWFHVMHGGTRIPEPRDPQQFHYAQLFRVRTSEREEYWLAVKDAVEPNRRNINGLYRVSVEIADGRAVCRNPEIIDWGVHTRLRQQVADRLKESNGTCEHVRVRELDWITPSGTLRFAHHGGRPSTWLRASSAGWSGMLIALVQLGIGRFEAFMGSNAFLTFFAAAFLMAKGVDRLMTFVFAHWFGFQQWFFAWFPITLPAIVALQLWLMLWLIGTKIPTMIDNNYKHLNRADNLRSLRRVAI